MYIVVDGSRSCSVTMSKTPAYILSESVSHGGCGRKSQPWILEAPSGQKINISLFDFTASNSGLNPERRKQQCRSHGLVIEKSGKRNASFCVTGERRQRLLYLSAGNIAHIVFDASTQQQMTGIDEQFMLKVEGKQLVLHSYKRSLHYIHFGRRGGPLVKSTPFAQSVVGSNPALAATWGLWASPSLSCLWRFGVKLRHNIRAVSGRL